MSDRFVYSCETCGNAIVSGLPPVEDPCPVCSHKDWVQEGTLR